MKNFQLKPKVRGSTSNIDQNSKSITNYDEIITHIFKKDTTVSTNDNDSGSRIGIGKTPQTSIEAKEEQKKLTTIFSTQISTPKQQMNIKSYLSNTIDKNNENINNKVNSLSENIKKSDEKKHKRNKPDKLSIMPDNKEKMRKLSEFEIKDNNYFKDDNDYSNILMEIMTMNKEEHMNGTVNSVSNRKSKNKSSSTKMLATYATNDKRENIENYNENKKVENNMKKSLTKQVMNVASVKKGISRVNNNSNQCKNAMSPLMENIQVVTKTYKQGEVSSTSTNLTKHHTKKKFSVDIDFSTNSKSGSSVINQGNKSLAGNINNPNRNNFQNARNKPTQKEIKLEFEENIGQKSEKGQKLKDFIQKSQSIKGSGTQKEKKNTTNSIINLSENITTFEKFKTSKLRSSLITETAKKPSQVVKINLECKQDQVENTPNPADIIKSIIEAENNARNRTSSYNKESNLNLFKKSTVNKSKNSHSSNSSMNMSKNNSIIIKVDNRNSLTKEFTQISPDKKEIQKNKENKLRIIETFTNSQANNASSALQTPSNNNPQRKSKISMYTESKMSKSKSKPLMKKVDIKKYFTNSKSKSEINVSSDLQEALNTDLKKVEIKLEQIHLADKKSNTVQKYTINTNNEALNKNNPVSLTTNNTPVAKENIDRSLSTKSLSSKFNARNNPTDKKKIFLMNPFMVPTVKTNLYDEDRVLQDNSFSRKNTVDNVLQISDSFFNTSDGEKSSNLAVFSSNRSSRRLKEARERRFLEKQQSENFTEDENEKPREKSNHHTNDYLDLDKLNDKLNSLCMNIHSKKNDLARSDSSLQSKLSSVNLLQVKSMQPYSDTQDDIRKEKSLSPAPLEGGEKLINRIRSRYRFDSFNSNSNFN